MKSPSPLRPPLEMEGVICCGIKKTTDYLPARFEKSSSEIHALGYSLIAAATAASYCCFLFSSICAAYFRSRIDCRVMRFAEHTDQNQVTC